MNDSLVQLTFLAHLTSTLFMVGLIWFVQIVHYPLFSNVGSQEFPPYEKRHTAIITWVVAPPMLFEGVTAVFLFWFRPARVPDWSLWIGLALLVVIWLSTWLIQVPCHEKLSRGFDLVVHQRLVNSNWLRTAAWSMRGFLVLLMLWMMWGFSNIEGFKIGDHASFL